MAAILSRPQCVKYQPYQQTAPAAHMPPFHLLQCLDPAKWIHFALQRRHKERDGVSNHQRLLFFQTFVQAQIKENINAPRHWPLWGEFTTFDRWINMENVSIWWCHHGAKDTSHQDQHKQPTAITVKPVYNDHLMEYFSASWSSSRWPRAT